MDRKDECDSTDAAVDVLSAAARKMSNSGHCGFLPFKLLKEAAIVESTSERCRVNNRPSYVLPNVLPGFAPADGVCLYAHTAREHDARSMISFTTNAVSVILSGCKRLQHGLADEGGREYRSMLVFFTDAQLADFLARHDLASRASALAQRSFVDFDAGPGLLHLAGSLWYAPDLGTLTVARKRAKLDDVLLLILELLGPDAFGFFSAGRMSAPGDRLKQIVEAHWQDDLSLEELAFLCHMSLSTFKRHFQAVFGVAPGQWMHERRLHLAAHLLKVERRRASDIYQDVGFSTVSAFTQSFKNFFGMTPKMYQNFAK